MTATELIAQLTAFVMQHGDADVYVPSGRGGEHRELARVVMRLRGQSGFPPVHVTRGDLGVDDETWEVTLI